MLATGGANVSVMATTTIAAVQAAPDWAVAHENLGDVYVRIAAGEYERAAKLDKESKSAGAKLVLARDILAPLPAK